MLYKFKKVDGVCIEFEPVGVDVDGEWVEFDCDVEPINEPYHSHNYEMHNGIVTKRSDGDIAAEDATNRAAEEEQQNQPTDADRLDAIESAICDLADMLLGGADND